MKLRVLWIFLCFFENLAQLGLSSFTNLFGDLRIGGRMVLFCHIITLFFPFWPNRWIRGNKLVLPMDLTFSQSNPNLRLVQSPGEAEKWFAIFQAQFYYIHHAYRSNLTMLSARLTQSDPFFCTFEDNVTLCTLISNIFNCRRKVRALKILT